MIKEQTISLVGETESSLQKCLSPDLVNKNELANATEIRRRKAFISISAFCIKILPLI